MLIGQYKSNLGLKRRVAIPKKFRKELGVEIIIARWYEGCLVLVSKDSWEALLKRLTGSAEIVTASVRDTDRFILGSAYLVEPDGQGRVIIPEMLTDYAGLKKELVFLGLGDRVEIWDRQVWKTKEKEVQEYASKQLEKIAKEGRKVGDNT